ncbi:MAG: class I SAM-dependent methyltransferase [Solirubrobacteraceae bacterium]
MTEQRPAGETRGASYVPLPSELDQRRAAEGGIFDRIASLYDRARPGYPPEAVCDLVQLASITGSSRILEIGCGTGQLTRDLAITGAAIRCVEPGPSLADIARANLTGYANVEVLTTTFEELRDEPGSYRTVVSATAFHWIDPSVAFVKAAALLKAGGQLALMTNIHAAEGTHTDERLAEAVWALHRRLAPEIGDWTFPTADDIERKATPEGGIGALWARVERKLSDPPDVSHLFERPTVKTYPWLARYDRSSYLDMLASQSSYALIEPRRRNELLVGIGQLIDERLTGVVTKQYVTILAIAIRAA